MKLFNYLSRHSKRRMAFWQLCLLGALTIITGNNSLSAQSNDQNYTATRIANAPITDTAAFKVKPLKDVKLSVDYKDGFGRIIQTVIKQGSLPTSTGVATDLVATSKDSSKSRYAYLPYSGSGADGSFKSNALGAQNTFYTGSGSPLAGQGESNFYSKSTFEASIGGSIAKAFAPGKNWVGSNRGVVTKKYANKTADSVRQWSVTNVNTIGSGFGTYSSALYPPGALSKTITTDEQQKQVIDFTDIDGRLVLRKTQFTASSDNGTGKGHSGWLCTYYIYDAIGHLRCVIEPMGIRALLSSNWVMTTNVLNEQSYRYEYGTRGLLIMKKAPGRGPEYIIYDKYSRPVMMQDAGMRTSNTWVATKYDHQNQPIYTYKYYTTTVFASLLSAAANSSAYPTASNPDNAHKLTQTHYSNYSGLPSNLSASYLTTWDTYFSATSTTSFPYAVKPAQSSNAIDYHGAPTWTLSRLLDSSSFLGTCYIYDKKGRLIQTQKQNITGGVDVTTMQYSWAGWPLVTVEKQEVKKGSQVQTTVIITKITYDDLGRPTKKEMRQSNSRVNNGAMSAYAVISEVQYDALGNIKVTRLGRQRTGSTVYSSTPLETVDYDYNVRGWLLGVNRDYARDLGTTNNSIYQGDGGSGESFTEAQDATVIYPTSHYFGFDLGYDKTNNNLINGQSYTTARYDGNIAGTVWKSANDQKVRKYDFTYDATGRILTAAFNQYTGNTFNKTAGVDYSVSNLSYDQNGNIQTMKQMGLKASGTSAVIDQMTYSYQSGTARLIKVSDVAPVDSAEHLGDFQDGNMSGNDYTYDTNGNLTSDLNKKISQIQYNYLNLPSVIRVAGKGSIYYTYDASGNKLRRVIKDSSSLPARVTTTLYVGSGIYQNDTLQFFGTGEGRARSTIASGWVYDYFLKDHLGNTRIVITDDYNIASPVLQASSYYPFGLEMKNIGLEASSNLANRYLFNGGSELNESLGINLYETNFRSLDPQLGRFWQIDPLAGQTPNISPYAFAGNNPIAFLDPMGLEMQPWNGSVEDFWQWFYHAGNGDQIYYDPDKGLADITVYGKWRNEAFPVNYHSAEYYQERFERMKSEALGGGYAEMPRSYKRTPVNIVTQRQYNYLDWSDINSIIKKGSTTAVALSDIYVHKHALPSLPKWLVGKFGRGIIMKGASEYTSYMSIVLRRMGWSKGARNIQNISFPTMIATMAIENGIYYNEIITKNPSLEDVEDHYDTPWNPVFWMYRRIENELKKF